MKRDDRVDARFLVNPMGRTHVAICVADGVGEQFSIAGGLIFAGITEIGDGNGEDVQINAAVIGTAAAAVHLIAHLLATVHRELHVPLHEALAQISYEAGKIVAAERSGGIELQRMQYDDITHGERIAIEHDEREHGTIDMQRCN